MLKRKKLIQKKDPEKITPYLIEEHDRISSPGHETPLNDPLSSTIPANAANLQIAERYREALPRLLSEVIPNTRDFFLKEIAPMSLGISNGLMDAHDILVKALDEEDVDTAPYISRIEQLAVIALEQKMITFVQGQLKLNEEESKRFLYGVLSKEVRSEDLSSLLMSILHPKKTEEPPPKRLPPRRRKVKK